MYPIHDTQTAQPETVGTELTRALFASVAAILLAAVFLAAVALLTSQPATTVNSSAESAVEVRDGWSSYLGAAAPSADRPVLDGWSSYLLTQEMDPAGIRDGWSSYLLVDEIDPTTVIDGWMTRYGSDD
jgi:hypothetical protein